MLSYLPSYWQTVQDESATISGLRTAPVLFCATIGSVAAGQSIARSTRWKPVPLVGTGLQVLGIGLLTTIAVDSSYVALAFFMAFTGIGYGLTGPSASIVVQSSVPLADLAAASAGGTFFNQLGGSVGVAVTGAVFNNLYEQRVTQLYAQQGLGPVPADPLDLSGSELAALTPAEQAAFHSGYVFALDRALYVVLAFAACQLVFTCLLEDVPLRGKARKQPADAPAADTQTAAAAADARPEKLQTPDAAPADAAALHSAPAPLSETGEAAAAHGPQVKTANWMLAVDRAGGAERTD